MTSTNLADSLASAAITCMGEGDEQRPLAIITKPDVVFTEKKQKGILSIDAKEDIFYPLLKKSR